MIISTEKRTVILAALLEKRKQYDGTDSQFSKQFGINASVFSRLKNGESGNLLRDAQWLNIARELDVPLTERDWKAVETEVFVAIRGHIETCKAQSASLILCDDCGIGKTYTAKYLSRTMKNTFYVDASQCSTKNEFTRAIAKAVGVDDTGKLAAMRANIKYALKALPNPVVIIDEAGDLDEKAFQLLKEFWNATENACGWYMMGADGLREKIERNIRYKKVGWREVFNRYNDRFNSIVPTDKDDKVSFYKKMITDVLKANMSDLSKLPEIVNRCLKNDSGTITGLRRAQTLAALHEETN